MSDFSHYLLSVELKLNNAYKEYSLAHTGFTSFNISFFSSDVETTWLNFNFKVSLQTSNENIFKILFS